METVSTNRCFGGTQGVYSHASDVLGCEMKFAVYTPPAAAKGKVPVLYWLSGLTCTEQNFTTKAGAQRYAAQHGIVVVAPDTSPRGLNIEGEDDAYDFGSGAGFYVNATQEPWAKNYKMYDYIVSELPALVEKEFPVDANRQAISGHSMGGHGALTVALKNPGRFKSVSAFAPIVAPSQVPWGHKALGGYLGDDRAAWADYDATALVAKSTERLPMLIDQGTADNFLEEQLKPQIFEEACKAADYPVTLRMQDGYDHSYYFISTFIGEHFAHHAKALGL